MAISVTVARAGTADGGAVYLARRTFDGDDVTIGSAPACDVCLPDPYVLPLQARLVRAGGGYALIDEGGAEGTHVDDVRLVAKRPRPVWGGEVVRVGPYRLELAVEAAAPAAPSEGGYSLAVALFGRGAERGEGPSSRSVEVTAGPDRRGRLALDEGRVYVLGRDPGADLPLREPEASRRHASLELRGGTLFVRDLGSSNGTTLGGASLRPGEDVAWPPGAELGVGDDRIVYRDPLAEEIEALAAQAPERPGAPAPSADGPSVRATPAAADTSLLPAAPPSGHLAVPTPARAAPPEAAPGAPPAAHAVAAFARSAVGAPVAEPPALAEPAEAEPTHAPARRRWSAMGVALAALAAASAAACLAMLLWLLLTSR